MVGTIKQQLYISGLPTGTTLKVTALNLLPPDPAKEWRATLYTASGAERVSHLSSASKDKMYIGLTCMWTIRKHPSPSIPR